MAKKVRVTLNNARAGKNGVFLPEHLDGPNGKASQMGGLLNVWSCDSDTEKPFAQVEADFYEEHFQAGLDAQNDRHIKARHKNRVRTMDEYRTHKNTCPESTLMYLGDKDDNAGPTELLRVAVEYLLWRRDRFPQVVPLDFALHIEDGAPHIHERHVWIGHDADGNEIANQEVALAEMGVLPPDPSEKSSRYNNAKMTYTEICRDKMAEIARAHGIEIDGKPREAGLKGRTQAKYKLEDTREKTRQWQQTFKAAREGFIQAVQGDLDGLKVQRAETRYNKLMGALGASIEAVKPVEADIMRQDGTTPVRAALEEAVKQPGKSGADVPIRSALAEQVIKLADRDSRKTDRGPSLWNGPKM